MISTGRVISRKCSHFVKVEMIDGKAESVVFKIHPTFSPLCDLNTFHSLNSDIPEDVSSLKEFTTAMIVAATSKCLHMIKEDLQIPSVLPASMSSKFRLGTTLANACQVCFCFLKF